MNSFADVPTKYKSSNIDLYINSKKQLMVSAVGSILTVCNFIFDEALQYLHVK